MSKVSEANDALCWWLADKLRRVAERMAEPERSDKTMFRADQAYLIKLAESFEAGWFEPTVYCQRGRPKGMLLDFDKRFEVAMFIREHPGRSLARRYEAAAAHFGISERTAERCQREFRTVTQMPSGMQRDHALHRLRWEALKAEAMPAKK